MKIHLLSAVAFGMLLAFGSGALAAKDANEKTLKDLQHAYAGESNANKYYAACAVKADEQGYHQVASLFRAAAEAEAIHAKNHAEVITAMGATPKAKLEKPDVKATKKNVEESYKDEKEESTKMYPKYVKEAKAADNTAAVRTFTYAKDAEAQHAKLFKEALDNMEKWRDGTKTFYVCTVCGYISEDAAAKKCPACASESFKEVK